MAGDGGVVGHASHKFRVETAKGTIPRWKQEIVGSNPAHSLL